MRDRREKFAFVTPVLLNSGVRIARTGNLSRARARRFVEQGP